MAGKMNSHAPVTRQPHPGENRARSSSPKRNANSAKKQRGNDRERRRTGTGEVKKPGPVPQMLKEVKAICGRTVFRSGAQQTQLSEAVANSNGGRVPAVDTLHVDWNDTRRKGGKEIPPQFIVIMPGPDRSALVDAGTQNSLRASESGAQTSRHMMGIVTLE